MARRPALTLTHRLQRFLALPRDDRRRFLVALLAVIAARFALWVAPYRRVRVAMLSVSRRPPGGLQPTPGSAARIGWAVSSAARFVPAATCLPQALAAEGLLRRAGHPATLHLGVARNERGAIEAHAWVESGDRVVVGGEELERYVRLTGGPG